uniref:Uncharacterized protein n=1 Tax=Solanum lycopersicum TaxID=4081 RepID=A0A3Q7GY49_SOLLC
MSGGFEFYETAKGNEHGIDELEALGSSDMSQSCKNDILLRLSILRNCTGFVLENIVLRLLCPVSKKCRETSILLMKA